MVFEGERLSYEQIGDRVNRLAFALDGLGIQKGDRIGMMSTNCPAYIETYFASAKIGAIFVPLNFRAKSDELEYMLGAAEAKILFAGNRYLEMVKSMAGRLSNLENSVSLDGPFEGMLNYADLVKTEAEDEFFADVEDDDTTILMFTSGTTGRPKAVPMTHDTFGAYILENVDPADPEPATVAFGGTVTDLQGRPLTGVTVRCHMQTTVRDNHPAVAETETDAEGRFALDAPDRPEGDPAVYWLIFDHEDHAIGQRLWSQEAPEAPTGLDVQLLPRASIAGTVADEQGAPVAGAVVEPVT